MSDKLLLQETEKGTSDSSSTKSPSEPLQHEQNIADYVNDEDVAKTSNVVSESSSPRYIDGVQSLLENGDSSYLFEQDQSDESLDEEDNFKKMLVTPVSGYMLPKIENGDYPELDAVNSCYLGFHGHDHDDNEDQSFGFWPY